MSDFGSKYLLIYTTTQEILLDPFGFGDRLTDSLEETKRAATYLGEGFLFFYALLKIFDPPRGDAAAKQIPFGDEIMALAIVAGAILAGLAVHPFVKAATGSSTRAFGTLSCFLYWTGFSIFVMPPIFTALLMGFESLVPAGTTSENVKFFTFMLIGVPFMFVYYVGTICTWNARVHNSEPIIAGIAIVIGYIATTGAVALLGWGVKSLIALF